MGKGRASLAALLFVVVPMGASAGASSPVKGDLTFRTEVELVGAASFEARSEGLLDLAHDVRSGALRGISWTSASGYLMTTSQNYTRTAVEARFGEQSGRETLWLGPGGADGLRCLDDCRAFLLLDRASGPGGLGVSGDVDGTLRWAREPRIYHALRGERTGAFVHEVPSGAFGAGGESRSEGLPLSDARPYAWGNVTLVLWGVSGALHAEGAARSFQTGERVTGGVGPDVAPVVVTVERRYLLLRLQEARFEMTGPSRALLLAPEPEVRVSGALLAPHASGTLLVDGEERAFRDAPVELEGDFLLRPVTRASGLAGLGPGERSLEGRVEGEASRVRLGGYQAAPGAEGAARAAAFGATALGLLAALLWAAKSGALGALYTRLRASTLLLNGNRRALLERIRAEPGLAVTALAERAGLAEVVVRHHLRVLERHALVVMQQDGRARRAFPLEARLDRAAIGQRLALRDATRRRLAESLLEGRLTQRDLMERVGVSQRLVSYHLRRLEKAGLVARHAGKPNAYEATPALREGLSG